MYHNNNTTHECLLCYEPIEIIGLLPCNHRYICYFCTIKLCQSGLCTCPICKIASKTILFTNDLDSDYDTLMEFENVVRSSSKPAYFYLNKTVQDKVERQNQFICWFENCKKQYNSLNTLKKHLNEDHHRQFCNLCLQFKKCLLSEQILYSDTDLIRHEAEGEFEETGVISLYHPYCEFCRVRFYDEDIFLKHLKSSHEHCHICDKQSAYKYVFFKDYKTMELHFDASHFMCKHRDCLEGKITNVFASTDLLDFHYAQVHLKQNFSNKAKRKMECNMIAGFNAQEIQNPVVIKDGYGKNFQKQLMSLMRQTELSMQEHKNGYVDIRQIYHKRAAGTKSFGVGEVISRMHEILEYQKGKDITENFAIQDIDLFKPYSMKSLTRDQIRSLIDQTLSGPLAHKLKKVFFDPPESKGHQEFNKDITLVLNQASYKLTFFYIFPQLIRFFRDAAARKRVMDEYYCRCLLELPVKLNYIIRSFYTYTELINHLKGCFESVILGRILSRNISLETYIKDIQESNSKHQVEEQHFAIQKNKVKNLYHMIEKVKTQDLLKLNWLLKVGLSMKTHEFITHQLYFSTIDKLSLLAKEISNSELCLLYVYFKGCSQAMEPSKNKFNYEKSKDDVNVLREFLSGYKEVIKNGLIGTNPKIAQLIAKAEHLVAPEVKYSTSSLLALINNNNNTSTPNIQPTKNNNNQKSKQYDEKFEKLETKKAIKKKIVSSSDSDEDLPSLPVSKPNHGYTNSNNFVTPGFANPVASIKKWDESKSAISQKQKQKTEEEIARQNFLNRMAKKPAASGFTSTTVITPTPQSTTTVSKPQSNVQKASKPNQTTDNYTSKYRVPELTQAEQIQLALEQSERLYKQEQKKQPKSNKNVFQMLDEEFEEVKSKKPKKNKKRGEVEHKQLKDILFKKVEEPENVHLFVQSHVVDEYQYPSLAPSKPEPVVKPPAASTNKNNTTVQTSKKDSSKPVEAPSKKKAHPVIQPEEDSQFPSLGGSTDASWIANVAGKAQEAASPEVKIRKKKGKKFVQEVVDLMKL